jgi:NTP pyrophosphatase (non-canonical NTP hydrolase)
MNGNEYQKAAERTESKLAGMYVLLENKNTVDIDPRFIHAVMGLVTESAELMDILKKYIYYRKPFTKEKIEDELGDSLWYIALACNALGITIEQLMDKNIHKLKVRYPEKFTEENALNRDLKKEQEVFTNIQDEWDNNHRISGGQKLPNTPEEKSKTGYPDQSSCYHEWISHLSDNTFHCTKCGVVKTEREAAFNRYFPDMKKEEKTKP